VISCPYTRRLINRLSNFEVFEAMIFQSVVFWDIKPYILVGEHYHFAGSFPSLILRVGVTDPEGRVSRFLRSFGVHIQDYATQQPRESVDLFDWFSKILP
jgi:hypothetical protein